MIKLNNISINNNKITQYKIFKHLYKNINYIINYYIYLSYLNTSKLDIYTIKSFKKNILLKPIFLKNILNIYNSSNTLKYIKNKNKKFNNITLYSLLEKYNQTVSPKNTLLNILFKYKAKSNLSIFNQLIKYRGYISDLNNITLKLPILNTLISNNNIYEYLYSTYGARKGIIDTSLNTSEAGYLNKMLLNFTNDIFINEYNCFSTSYTIYKKYILFYKGNINKKYYKYIFLNKIIYMLFNLIFQYNIYKIKPIYKIKSILNCINIKNVCATCYNMQTNQYYNLTLPIGVLTAQNITEPNTQITLKTFHTGGLTASLNNNISTINTKIYNNSIYKNKYINNYLLVKKFNLKYLLKNYYYMYTTIKFNNVSFINLFFNINCVFNIYLNKFYIFKNKSLTTNLNYSNYYNNININNLFKLKNTYYAYHLYYFKFNMYILIKYYLILKFYLFFIYKKNYNEIYFNK